jgi:hypothetical protein
VTLVDLGQERVGRVREDGGGETGNDTRREGDAKVLRVGEVLALLRRHAPVDVLEAALVDGKLSDGVRDLLAQDGDEAGVQRADALGLEDLGERGHHAVGKLGVGDEADTRRLGGSEEDVGEELGDGGAAEVDGCAVLDGRLARAREVDEVLLGRLVAGKLGATLEAEVLAPEKRV